MSDAQKVMYVGPTLEAIAMHNTVYKDLPDGLKVAIEKRPYLAGLCVPISGLAVALKLLWSKSGHIYRLYKKAESERSAIEKGV